MRIKKVYKDRHIRFFISSTFSDMYEERELLLKKVFPRLRKLCDERQVVLTEVDLRWGIDEAHGDKIVELCLSEIERSRPWFIGLLGERYGSILNKTSQDLLKSENWLNDYLGKRSITELEILHGVLNNPKMQNHAFFYFRDPRYIKDLPNNINFSNFQVENNESAKKLQNLKNRIRHASDTNLVHLREPYSNPEQLAQWIEEDLCSLINRLFPKEDVPNSLSRIEIEQDALVRSLSRQYIERPEAYKAIDTFIDSETTQPLLITGESGIGKSALLANWGEYFRSLHPEILVHYHFLGVDANGNDWFSIVRRLIETLNQRFNFSLDISTEADQLRQIFAKALILASEREPIIIIIDALNEIENQSGTYNLLWLPSELPHNIKIIVSTLKGNSLEVLRERNVVEYNVKPLSEDEQKRLIFIWLRHWGKELNNVRTKRIVQHHATSNPLFLRTFLGELRVFGSHEELDQKIDYYLAANNPTELFQKVLSRYEEDYEDKRHSLVKDTFSFIACTRMGLAENELLELLGDNFEEPLANAIWSPLHLAAEPGLVFRNGRIKFAHNYFREAVEARYLSNEKELLSRHNRLADYFLKMDGKVRWFDELPWQYVMSQQWGLLYALLCDLKYITIGIEHIGVYALIEEYQWIIDQTPDFLLEVKARNERMKELKHFAHELINHASSWSSKLGRCTNPFEQTSLSIPYLDWEICHTAFEGLMVGHQSQKNNYMKKFSILDVRSFNSFLHQNASVLSKYPKYLFVCARNSAKSGVVAKAGEFSLKGNNNIWIKRNLRPEFQPIKYAVIQSRLLNSENGIKLAIISDDGMTVVGGTNTGALKVWDAVSGYEKFSFLTTKNQKAAITAIVLTPDGSLAACGNAHGELYIWDVKKGILLLELLDAHLSAVNSIDITPDGCTMISGGKDKIVHFWNLQTGEKLYNEFLIQEHGIRQVIIQPYGTFAVSINKGDQVHFWVLDTNVKSWQLPLDKKSLIRSIALTPNGSELILGGNGLYIWDIRQNKQKLYLPTVKVDQKQETTSVKESNFQSFINLLQEGDAYHLISQIKCINNGKLILTKGNDRYIRIWDLENEKGGSIVSIAEINKNFSSTPDGHSVLSMDGMLTIWNPLLQNVEEDHIDVNLRVESYVTSFISMDGQVGIREDSTEFFMDFFSMFNVFNNIPKNYKNEKKSGNLWKVFNPLNRNIYSQFRANKIDMTSDGKYIAFNIDNKVKVKKTFKVFNKWKLPRGLGYLLLTILSPLLIILMLYIFGGKITQNNRMNNISIVSYFKKLFKRSFPLKDRLKTLISFPIVLILFITSLFYIIVDKSIKIIIATFRQFINSILGLFQSEDNVHSNQHIYSIVISDDSKIILTGDSNGTLQYWKRGRFHVKLVSKLMNAHENIIGSIAISSNGEKAITSSSDGTLKIWNLDTLELLKCYEHQEQSYGIVKISADGKVIAHSIKKGIYLRDTTKNEKPIIIHTKKKVKSFQLTQNGKLLLLSNDTSITVWDTITGQIKTRYHADEDLILSQVNKSGNFCAFENQVGLHQLSIENYEVFQ